MSFQLLNVSSNAAAIVLLETILKLVPKPVINKLVISPRSKRLVQMYGLLPKPKGPIIYKIAKRASIWIDLSKPGERAISFDAFEPQVTERVLSLLGKDDIVLDIGSWIGYYTLIAASRVGSKGKVISIEPHRENFKRLFRNVDLNEFTNINLLNSAVGREKSRKVLVDGVDSLTHRVIDDEASCGNEIAIDSIDNIIADLGLDYVNLVIMDIEGGEYDAVLGAYNALTKGIIKNIICEIHPDKLKLNGTSDTELLNYLATLGYKVNKFTNMVNVYHIHITR